MEFVSHNGRTSFLRAQLRTPKWYHQRGERRKNISKTSQRSSFSRACSGAAHVALWLSEGGYTQWCRREAERLPEQMVYGGHSGPFLHVRLQIEECASVWRRRRPVQCDAEVA